MASISAKYTFLPWLRQGLSTLIVDDDQLGLQAGSAQRPTFPLHLSIRHDDQPLDRIDQNVTLLGPGDVLGINRRAIVRTDPRPGLVSFEPNYLPFIEFYEEDFPWRYTPARARTLAGKALRLRPWLALIVLEEGSFVHDRVTRDAKTASVTIEAGPTSALFPPAAQSWAWAHVHVSTGLRDTPDTSLDTVLDRLTEDLSANPNLGCSRLLCPIRLKPTTAYHAFLIPTFEQGRLAGLGATAEQLAQHGNQQSSWGEDPDIHRLFPNRWPVYFDWEFRTSEAGDFESLVRQIVPRSDLDPRIGKELVDIQDPGWGLHYRDEHLGGAIYREGAVRIPDNGEPSLLDRYVTGQDPPGEVNRFIEDLSDLVNLDQDLRDDNLAANRFRKNPFFDPASELPAAEDYAEDDPIVTPPFYGRWHAAKDRLNPAQQEHWYNQLNLAPRNRIVAGFGTEVIRRHQEDLMDRAWEQLGELQEVNERLRKAQFSLELSKKLFSKHIAALPAAELVRLTSSVHAAVKIEGGTLAGGLFNSTLPQAVVAPTYQKLTRTTGPLARRVTAGVRQQLSTTAMFSAAQQYALRAVFILQPQGQKVQFQLSDLNRIMQLGRNFRFNPFVASHNQRASRIAQQYGVDLFTLKAALPDLMEYFEEANWPAPPSIGTLNFATLRQQVIAQLDPRRTLTRQVYATIDTGDQPPPEQDIDLIRAHPEFSEPMYQPLTELAADLMMPNLDLIPPDTFALLENNQEFIEAYLVGLNHEMARELLWRRFPTDQRGTYFRQFWDVGDHHVTATPSFSTAAAVHSLKDIEEIHRWPHQRELGHNQPPGRQLDGDNLVFVIRGELLKKFPNILIYMQPAAWQLTNGAVDKTLPRELDEERPILSPLFRARLDPDIYFLGFNLTVEEALGNREVDDQPGWFFVLQERPGEARFGLDETAGDDDEEANPEDALTWDRIGVAPGKYIDFRQHQPESLQIGSFAWGTGSTNPDPSAGSGNAADTAAILYQKPFMIAIHAAEMEPGLSTTSTPKTNSSDE